MVAQGDQGLLRRFASRNDGVLYHLHCNPKNQFNLLAQSLRARQGPLCSLGESAKEGVAIPNNLPPFQLTVITR
jgi:hypothetical protein